MAYEQKTKPTGVSVEKFLNTIEDEKKRKDSIALLDIMQEVSGYEPYMFGTSIVGFGTYHYKYASGHEGDSCIAGFSPRKANITIYSFDCTLPDESLTGKLGKFKTGKGCLYINKLEDINIDIFEVMLRASIEKSKKMHLANS